MPFEDKTFNVVTMLAVLEHLDKPVETAKEIARVLTPGGRLVLTVPSKLSKPVVEFLAYKVKIVNEAEIRDHKRYYDYNELRDLFSQLDDLEIEKHKYFQLGLNNFCIVRKN